MNLIDHCPSSAQLHDHKLITAHILVWWIWPRYAHKRK